MTKEQLQTIAGLIAGMETAVVHLSNVICQQTEISHDDLAKSFEATSASIPSTVENRELIQTVLKHVASGIRSNSGYDWQQLIAKLLH